MFPLNAYIATQLRNYQIIQMKRKDERVKMMNETLSGIKVRDRTYGQHNHEMHLNVSKQVLKLYAWELSFQENIQNIRDKELEIIMKTAYMNGFLFFVWTTAPFFVSFDDKQEILWTAITSHFQVTLASFATYVLIDENNVFDANAAYVTHCYPSLVVDIYAQHSKIFSHFQFRRIVTVQYPASAVNYVPYANIIRNASKSFDRPNQ